MRRVVATLDASVDGYASDVRQEELRWTLDDLGEEATAFTLAGLRAADTLLLGRVTYELFARRWRSTSARQGEYADLLNRIPKVVISRTLTDEQVTWGNTRVVHGGLEAEIGALKREPGKDIALCGSVELVASLMELGLIDRLQLQIHPIVLGSEAGKAIFDGYLATPMRLVETTVLDGSVVVLDYEPLPS